MNIVLRWYLRCIERGIFKWWCRKCSCYLIPMSHQKWGGVERENIVYANQYSKNVLSSCPKDRIPRFTCSYRLKIQAMAVSTWLQTLCATYLKTSREIKWKMKNSSCWGHAYKHLIYCIFLLFSISLLDLSFCCYDIINSSDCIIATSDDSNDGECRMKATTIICTYNNLAHW